MKSIFVWSPGASISTKDVFAGLRHGLEQQGVNVRVYDAEVEIELASVGLTHLWKGRGSPADIVPTEADKIYRSGKAVIADACRARLEHGVEWVLIVSGMYQHPDFFLLLRHVGFKVALLCTESPYDLEFELRAARHVDAVFTNERTCVETFRAVNPHVAYLPHAWHPGVHTTMALGDVEHGDAPAHDVVFVGTYFQERVEFLASIDWTGINLGLYGGTDEIDRRTKAGRALAPFVKGGYTKNTRTAALYRQAAIGLNFHRQSKGFGPKAARIVHAESLNPRCYELAATGCFFVSDRRAEAADVFGDALPTFESPAECEALVRAALADPAARAAQATACLRAVQGQTWTARAAAVVDHLVATDAALRERAA
jgi:hypothetical protein